MATAPPAYWAAIAPIRQLLSIPVIANGEIWTQADAERCRAESGCHALMLGRGMVADPGLARAIRDRLQPDLDWPEVMLMLTDFWQQTETYVKPPHRAGLLKQWLNLLRRHHPAAQTLYQTLRPLTTPAQVQSCLQAERNRDGGS